MQVKEVCTLVVLRSARLVAAALSGLLLHLQRAGPRGGRVPPHLADAEPPHHTNMAFHGHPSTGAMEHEGLPKPTQVGSGLDTAHSIACVQPASSNAVTTVACCAVGVVVPAMA